VPIVKRRARKRANETPPASDGFVHSSKRDDLESLIADHVLPADAAETTMADWTPSRRGNSPREPGRRFRRFGRDKRSE